MITPRIDRSDFARLTGGLVPALQSVGKALGASGLGADLLELVQLRASQLNGCPFCLQVHLQVARGLKVPTEKLDLLAAWRDAPTYTARERAALAWTEAVTLAAQGSPDNRLYEATLAEFGAADLAYLTAAIAHINAWNRIATALRFAPPRTASTTTDTAHTSRTAAAA